MTALPFSVCRAAEIEIPKDQAQWLIRDLWGRCAVGIVGGAPKSYKSWFALDLVTSVASNTPCLGRFEVFDPGPALVFLAEDELVNVRARLDAISSSRGIALADLDVHVITEPVVRLDLATHRDRLVATVTERRPRILLLDPLVRLHRVDENSAQEISLLLGFLRELQRTFDCAVVLVHHTSKKNRSRPGLALRGSSDLHAFGDSNAYLTVGEHSDRLRLILEHRAAPAPPAVDLRVCSRPDGSATHLVVSDDVPAPSEQALPALIIEALRVVARPIPRRTLRDQLRVNNNRLGDVLLALEQEGKIRRDPDGWRIAN